MPMQASDATYNGECAGGASYRKGVYLPQLYVCVCVCV